MQEIASWIFVQLSYFSFSYFLFSKFHIFLVDTFIENICSCQMVSHFTSSCRRLPLEYLYNFHISRLQVKLVKSLPFCSLKSESWGWTDQTFANFLPVLRRVPILGFWGYRSFSIVMTLSTSCAHRWDDHWPLTINHADCATWDMTTSSDGPSSGH